MLDQFLDDLQAWWDARIADVEWILRDAINQTNNNSQKIWDKIQTESAANSDVITTEMLNVWTMQDDHMTATDDILSTTSATCDQIESDVQLLPTMDGLTNYLSAENLQIVSSIYGVTNAVDRVDSSIGRMTDAVNQISSKVEEYNGYVLKAIASAQAAAEAAQQAANDAMARAAEAKAEAAQKQESYSSDKDKDKDKEQDNSSNFNIYNGFGQLVGTADSAVHASQQANAIKNSYNSGFNGMPSDVIEKMKKMSITKAAKGSFIGKDADNPLDAIARSLGEDHMVAAKEGERILTEEQNRNFEKMVNNGFMPVDPTTLSNFTKLIDASANYGADKIMDGLSNIAQANTPVANSTAATSTAVDVGGVNINLPNVTDKEQFVSWLKNDSQIEKIVQSMSLGKIAGGNSFAKKKY